MSTNSSTPLPTEAELLSTLTEAQRLASTLPPNIPLQILAGPGSGKTRVLTSRVAWLVKTQGVKPEDCVVVTFTNKAANEMRKRLDKLIGAQQTARLIIGTFHATCARFLRRYGGLIGLANNFSILDADDSKRMIKEIIKDLSETTEARSINIKPEQVQSEISRAKARSLSALEYRTTIDEEQAMESGPGSSKPKAPVWRGASASYEVRRYIADVYERYEVRLYEINGLDFDDLLVKGLQLLRDHQSVLTNLRHVLVDEFQDTNSTQYALMSYFARATTSRLREIPNLPALPDEVPEPVGVSVVGDPDQSIYGWRNAEIGNLKRMKEDFKGTRAVHLEENFRSTAEVLQASLLVVEQDRERIAKGLFTSHPQGARVILRPNRSATVEAQFIATEIKRLIAFTGGKLTYDDFAVLLRYNAMSREVETQLQRESIPSRMMGGSKFFDRTEIKDILTYLTLAENPTYTPALLRIINVPKRGIGEKSVQELVERARAKGVSPMKLVESIVRGKKEAGQWKPTIKKGLTELVAIVKKIRKLEREGKTVPELINVILEEGGYRAHLRKVQDYDSRWENVKELITFADIVAQAEGSTAELRNFSAVLDDQMERRKQGEKQGASLRNFLEGGDEGLESGAEDEVDPEDDDDDDGYVEEVDERGNYVRFDGGEEVEMEDVDVSGAPSGASFTTGFSTAGHVEREQEASVAQRGAVKSEQDAASFSSALSKAAQKRPAGGAVKISAADAIEIGDSDDDEDEPAKPLPPSKRAKTSKSRSQSPVKAGSKTAIRSASPNKRNASASPSKSTRGIASYFGRPDGAAAQDDDDGGEQQKKPALTLEFSDDEDVNEDPYQRRVEQPAPGGLMDVDEGPKTPLRTFLEASTLSTDMEAADEASKGPKVSLATVHAAKGLEFAVVFVVGVEDGTFPFHRCKEPHEVAEERRLLYVAMTRAQALLYLTHCTERFFAGETMPKSLSQFVKPIIASTEAEAKPPSAIEIGNGRNPRKVKYRFASDRPTIDKTAREDMAKVLGWEMEGDYELKVERAVEAFEKTNTAAVIRAPENNGAPANAAAAWASLGLGGRSSSLMGSGFTNYGAFGGQRGAAGSYMSPSLSQAASSSSLGSMGAGATAKYDRDGWSRASSSSRTYAGANGSGFTSALSHHGASSSSSSAGGGRKVGRLGAGGKLTWGSAGALRRPTGTSSAATGAGMFSRSGANDADDDGGEPSIVNVRRANGSSATSSTGAGASSSFKPPSSSRNAPSYVQAFKMSSEDPSAKGVLLESDILARAAQAERDDETARNRPKTDLKSFESKARQGLDDMLAILGGGGGGGGGGDEGESGGSSTDRSYETAASGSAEGRVFGFGLSAKGAGGVKRLGTGRRTTKR